MAYLTALDPHLDEAGVSHVGKMLVRGLPDWQSSPQNATHFYERKGAIQFVFPSWERREDFYRSLEISERTDAIMPGDAEKICQAFGAFAAARHQQVLAHLDAPPSQLSLLDRMPVSYTHMTLPTKRIV